jgi:uncharacterized repeat protein (TIGR01451 family)
MRGMIRNLATAFVLLISLGYPAKSGAVDFAPPKTYPVGTSPSAAIGGDFNGDGKRDIAVANFGSNNVSILLGNGDGTFQPAVDFDAGLSPNSIAVGDFNGDGKMDLAVFQAGNTSNATAGAISILLGNGNGTFQAPKTTALTEFSSVMAVADFNLDQKSDLAVSSFDPNTGLTVSIFLGKGDGTFQSAKNSSVPTGGGGSFVVADFNGDAKPDLAFAGAPEINILLGKGDGTFQQAPGTSATISFPPASILAGDFRGGGKQDLIVKSRQSSGTPPGCKEFCISSHADHISIFFGNGDGSFQAEQIIASAVNIATTLGLGNIALGNFNGDTKLDLVNARTSSSSAGVVNSLEVRLGRGDGTFSKPIVLDATGISLALAENLNADKLSDLIARGTANDIAVLLNTSPASGADLGIIQSGASPGPVGVGTNLTYTADVLNQGPQDATGVTFTDTLPNNVNFVSATATQGSCVQSHGIVTCNIGSLASAFDSTVSIVVTPTAVGTITNSMNVTVTEPDLVDANNSATQTSTVAAVYTLTVAKAGNGTGTVTSDTGLNGAINCGSSCSATYLSGTVMILNENPDPNSFFEGWGGACSGHVCAVTMDADKSVTANFVLGMKLNVSLAGSGSGSVTSNDGAISCGNSAANCSSLYLPGASVSLTAVPAGTSVFAGWSGACTGTDPNVCSVTMNSNQSVTAKFDAAPDFTMNPVATSLTVKRGGQVSDVVTFPAQGGFSGSIALACSVAGPAPMPTCGISPSSVTPGNSATLTVNAGVLSASLTAPWFEQGGRLYAAWLPLGLLGCVLATGFDKKRRRMWALCLLMGAATILPAACGGGSSGPPPPVSQTYTVTVAATSGTLQHSTTVSVTVN